SNGAGEGFASYTVMANQAAPTGSVIGAQAAITFDTQPPLNTPLIFNTVDTGAGLTSAVAGLPARQAASQFNVAWSGSDAADSAGVAFFTISVSDNGGPFTPWLTSTTL